MDLPDHVVLEILSRFPVDRAAKIQALSKSHNKASYHSYYKTLISKHQLILDGFLLQTRKSNGHIVSFVSPQPNINSPPLDLSLSFLPGRNPQILAVGPNGLLVCETQHPIHYDKCFYTITKLSTKQWKGLPIPKTRYFTSNVAMHIVRSNPLHFKILRLSRDQIPSKRPSQFSHTICEVFDSKSWWWMQLDDIVQDDNSGFIDSHCAPVFAYGSAHWKLSNETFIFAFDFDTETCCKIAMPDTIINEYKEIRNNDEFQRWRTELVEYEGKLGVMREFFGPPLASTELWVMENSNNNKRIWTKKLDFLGSMPMNIYGSNILMNWLYNNNVMFSNLETGEFDCKKLEQSHYSVPLKVFSFLSDFESWNFDPPERSIKRKTMIKILRKSKKRNFEF